MDKIAIISDIHGNIPALEAVLLDIKDKGINRIICLGDLIGKGPSSEEAVDMIRDNCEVVLKGNWDYLVSEIYNSDFLQWHRSKLRDTQIQYLMDLSIYAEFYFSGKLVRLFHSTPNDIYPRVSLSANIEDKMALFIAPNEETKECDMVIYGHIHKTYIENFRGKTLFNVGSVGNSMDIAHAAYGIIEGKYGIKENSSVSITLVRVPYETEKAIQQAIDSGMPGIEGYINELKTAQYSGSINREN